VGRSIGLQGPLLVALIACFACTGFAPASAQATYHQIKIREVHEGSGAEADYVVLQMFAAGQTQIANRYLITYDSGGNVYKSFKFPSDVANGQNQRTILVASALMDDIGVTPDFTAEPNFFPGPPGSVCYEAIFDDGNFAIDCVAIGSVTAPHGNSSLVGSPVLPLSGLLPGQSVIRSIARGCKTLLEDSDDTNNSAADFALGTPSPRRNSMAPTEKSCSGGGGVASDAPNTKITKRPKNRSDDTSPTWKFKSTESGSKFKCKLDRKRFRKCRSPKTYRGLDPGRHSFRVEAIDADGNVDKTPAKDKFKVLP
jgi:hypothetical protein